MNINEPCIPIYFTDYKNMYDLCIYIYICSMQAAHYILYIYTCIYINILYRVMIICHVIYITLYNIYYIYRMSLVYKSYHITSALCSPPPPSLSFTIIIKIQYILNELSFPLTLPIPSYPSLTFQTPL